MTGASAESARSGDPGTILMVAQCGAAVSDGVLRIDRKFHTGMLEFARRIPRRMACLLPRVSFEESAAAMDQIELRLETLPYDVHLVPAPLDGTVATEAIDGAQRRAALVCVGSSIGLAAAAADRCRRAGIRYVVVTEYTLRTELDIMRATTPSALRRMVREFRLRVAHRRKLERIAGALEVHANGYPTYEELAEVNPRRVLFLDWRAGAGGILSDAALEDRLRERAGRPARLLFSGRYHPMKGALDVVKAGVELARGGLDFRLDLYGRGPQNEAMKALVASAGLHDRICVHDAIPYDPDLIEAARRADLFLCGHVQGDPSCTYLETFASGVPIVGYANEMWTPLCAASRAGDVVTTGDFPALAAGASRLLGDDARLRQASRNALAFARENSTDRVFDLRSQRMTELAGASPAGAG